MKMIWMLHFISMENIRRIIRYFVIIILIILATVGIGITGVAPNVIPHKRNQDNSVKIELVEDKERKKKASQTVEIN